MIQDIKDRLPTKPNTWEVTHSDSTVEEVTVARADEPTEVGTPINSALFKNLQGDLYTIDRSVFPTSVSLDNGTVKMNVDLPLTSYETGKLIRLRCLTPNTTWAGDNITFAQLGLEEITASSNSSEVYNTIDGFDDTYWNSDTDVEYQNVWVKYKFKSIIKINKLKIKIRASGSDSYFASGKIQGSNNNSTWTDLCTLSSSSQLVEVTLNTSEAYRYYRVVASTTSSSRSIYLYEVQVTEFEGYSQAVKNPTLNINNLGEKLILGTLYSGMDYLLRYSGSSWNIISNPIITGTFSLTRDKTATINVGFKPKLVIIYSKRNNTPGVGTGSTSSDTSHVPIILSDQYSEGKGAITSTGFSIVETNTVSYNVLYYVAIGG